MPIYRGTAFKKYLIDRYAMGFDPERIAEEFERDQKIPISQKEVESLLGGCEKEIIEREQELLKELTSKNLFSALSTIKEQLDDVRELVKSDGDYKTYAQLTNSSIKSLEVIMQSTENFKKRQETARLVAVQNNYYAIQILEKDGLIKVVDEPRLREILGAEEVKP